MKEEKICPEVTPLMTAFALVPIGDLFLAYKTNDAFGDAITDNWKMYKNIQMAGGAAKRAIFAAAIPICSIHAKFRPIVIASTIQEFAAAYYFMQGTDEIAIADESMVKGIFAGVFSINFANLVQNLTKGPDDRMDMESEDVDGDSGSGDDYGYSGYYWEFLFIILSYTDKFRTKFLQT